MNNPQPPGWGIGIMKGSVVMNTVVAEVVVNDSCCAIAGRV
jgi:hypothetical protein